MKRLAMVILAAALAGGIAFWWLTRPVVPPAGNLSEAGSGDQAMRNGERVFWASGCASCHAARDASGEEKLKLGGGHRLDTPFGTFVTPNITPDPATGIGNWSLEEFAASLRQGISPDGRHYYPSFPYASYAAMTDTDVADLHAYIRTLPAVSRANEPHELPLPFQWRRPLGLWKVLFSDVYPSLALDGENPKLKRGKYLVEVLGHCAECHTPRNLLGGMKTGRWLAGGPAPEGKGRIPNITPHETGIGSWSEADIAYYLESGFTPDYDSVGGSMVAVQENMAKLPASDREAIAAYLKAVEPVPSD